MAYGDVLLIDLPPSNGREQSGRRPTVVVQSNTANEPTLIVAPVTSNLRTNRFAFSVRVEPTPENGLTVPSVVLVFQLRAVDKDRIIRKLGQLSAEDLALVEAEVWRMLRPPTAEK
jgi:mRNA interferase MazF